jgi:hypothetical protein
MNKASPTADSAAAIDNMNMAKIVPITSSKTADAIIACKLTASNNISNEIIMFIKFLLKAIKPRKEHVNKYNDIFTKL